MFSNHSFILLTALTGVLVIGFKFFQVGQKHYSIQYSNIKLMSQVYRTEL